MSTSVAVGALFAELIDDAGLFPPAKLPMREAVAAHLATRSGAYAPLVGRFLVPNTRIAEFKAALPSGHAPFIRTGVIGDDGLGNLKETLQWEQDSGFEIELIEIPTASSEPDDVATMAIRMYGYFGDRDIFVELPRTSGWIDYLETNLSTLKRSGLGAKFRTGGVVAEAFPSEAQVAAFIAAAVNADVPFKLTAGLHNALRHTDPTTGFEHHGFLNVALAVAEPDRAESWLAERDGATVAAAVRTIDAALVRSRWRAFGSCSIDEPVDDLIALGLMERA